MSDTNYGFVIVDSEGDDLGDVFGLTDELMQNPQLLIEKVNEVIKKHEDALQEDDNLNEELEEDDD
jgi:hypothetical protein